MAGRRWRIDLRGGTPKYAELSGRALEQALAAGSNDLREVHRAVLEGKGEAELAPLMMRQARSIELFSQVPASNDDDDDDDELEVLLPIAEAAKAAAAKAAAAARAPAAGTYLRSISYDANGKVETHSLPDSRVHQPQRPLAPGFGTELEAMRRWCLVSAQLGHFTPARFRYSLPWYFRLFDLPEEGRRISRRTAPGGVPDPEESV
jgi:hypothetical protein